MDVNVPLRRATELDFADFARRFGTAESSPWAVLKCKFADDTTPSPPDEHYERLFTAAGNGSSNVVDFFRDVSHGRLDLGASEVFGWFTLALKRADFAGNVEVPPKGKVNRGGLLAACRQAAIDAKVDLGRFSGFVVAMNGMAELFGIPNAMAAMCDGNSLKPSLLGQEMGHGYGLMHSRMDGSLEEYADPWDVMSTASPYMAPNEEYEFTGPGLNAWNMRSVGWLDEARVWKSSAHGYNRTVQLRPLHRHDLGGYLAAELGEFLVEYRQREHWDSSIPRSCVMVHRFEDTHSYVMQGEEGSVDLGAGEGFQTVDEGPFRSRYALRVEEIDEEKQLATVRVIYHPAPTIPDLRGQIFGGVPVGGGGHVWIGGKLLPVPPKGPVTELLKRIVAYVEGSAIENAPLRSAAQRLALTELTRQALSRLRELDQLPDEERSDARGR